MCLGGSTTEGIGVSNGETYPAFLEKILAPRRVGGRRIEVVNAGFSGFGSRDLYFVFRNLVLPLEPDLILYYEVGNRVNEGQFYDRGPRSERPVIQWIANRFAVYRGLRQIVGVPMPYRQTYTFTEHRLTPTLDSYLTSMGSIADLARERHCVGANRELFLYHNPTMFDPVHYSARGNERIARCMADALMSRVLPDA